jgi:peptidoglycan/LPS O-acetylase OafA/YrhL
VVVPLSGLGVGQPALTETTSTEVASAEATSTRVASTEAASTEAASTEAGPATRPGAGARRRRFGGLDGLRAVGALAVMGTHVGFDSGDALRGPFSGVLSRLDAGVALFFVISGFLLYRPHLVAMAEARPRPATGNYLWHRALRILPALWIATALAAFLLPQPPQVTLAWYLRHAALIQIYFPAHQVAGLTQMWSLATEGAFYVTLPLLAWFMSRRGFSTRADVYRQLVVLAVFAIGGPIWKAAETSPSTAMNALWLPGYLGWFGAGMLLAVWQVARSEGLIPDGFLGKLAGSPGTVWAGALAVFALATSTMAGPYDLSPSSPGQAAAKSVLYAVLATLIVFPAVASADEASEPAAVRALGGRVGHFLGDISYGVFAYHVLVLGVVELMIGHIVFSGGFGTLFALTLSISVVLATLSYRLVERPIMRRGRRDRHFDLSPSPDTTPTDGSSRRAAAQARAKASKVRP